MTIQDRTREHLGTTDKVIMANRRQLLSAIDAVQAGGTAPFCADPALAAEQVGGAQQSLDLTLAYCAERQQFGPTRSGLWTSFMTSSQRARSCAS